MSDHHSDDKARRNGKASIVSRHISMYMTLMVEVAKIWIRGSGTWQSEPKTVMHLVLL